MTQSSVQLRTRTSGRLSTNVETQSDPAGTISSKLLQPILRRPVEEVGLLWHPIAQLYLVSLSPVRGSLSVIRDNGPGLPTMVDEVARRRVRPPEGARRPTSNMCLATFTPPPGTGPEKDAQRVLHVRFRTASLCQRRISRLLNDHDPLLLLDVREKEVARVNLRQRSHALLPQVSVPFPTSATSSSRTVYAPTETMQVSTPDESGI